jgi:glutathione peroxidase
MSLYDITVKDIKNNPIKLEKFKDTVLLIVNTASKCGFTYQYADLQLLYEDFDDDKFFVLGFPCNQFGSQEPGTNEEIQTFCNTKYNVTFPIFSKVDVKGPNQSEIYKYLTEKFDVPKWNFHKYLVSKKGDVVASFPSNIKPQDPNLMEAIFTELDK